MPKVVNAETLLASGFFCIDIIRMKEKAASLFNDLQCVGRTVSAMFSLSTCMIELKETVWEQSDSIGWHGIENTAIFIRYQEYLAQARVCV